MNILNDIKNIQKKISNFYIKDITYKTKKNFNIKFEINKLKVDKIYCNKKILMRFILDNLGIISLIVPFQLIKLDNVVEKIPKKYILIEKYEKELLIKKDKQNLPNLNLNYLYFDTYHSIKVSNLFENINEVDNILILEKQVKEIKDIYSINLHNLYSHTFYLSNKVKYNNIDIVLVESGRNITDKKISSAQFRKLLKNRKDNAMKVIDIYNKDSIKYKYQVQ